MTQNRTKLKSKPSPNILIWDRQKITNQVLDSYEGEMERRRNLFSLDSVLRKKPNTV